MKETDFNEAKESKEENIDVKELLFKYLIHWPWFVGAVIACLIAAWVYLYMSTPVLISIYIRPSQLKAIS